VSEIVSGLKTSLISWFSHFNSQRYCSVFLVSLSVGVYHLNQKLLFCKSGCGKQAAFVPRAGYSLYRCSAVLLPHMMISSSSIETWEFDITGLHMSLIASCSESFIHAVASPINLNVLVSAGIELIFLPVAAVFWIQY